MILVKNKNTKTLLSALFLLSIVTATHAQQQGQVIPPPALDQPLSSPEENQAVSNSESATPQVQNQQQQNKKKKQQQGDWNSESSSFVPDPDPIDPLPPKNENLKDEDGLIVEDIRQVLDQPLPPLPAPPPEQVASPPAPVEELNPPPPEIVPSVTEEAKTQPSVDVPAEPKEIIKKPRNKKSASSSGGGKSKRKSKRYSNNDPDLELEKRFHSLYKRMHAQPTSMQVWDAVTAPRKAELYMIQKGDNLYNISGTLFGDSQFWPKIWSLNEMDILNPHFIQPGNPIYFYPGTYDQPPTIGVEKTENTITPKVEPSSPQEEKPQADLTNEIQESAPEDGMDAIERSRLPIVSEEKAIDGRNYDRQNTEWKKNIIVKSKDSLGEEPAVLPRSLPEYFSGKYFEPKKADFTLDIKKAEVPEVVVPPNPYIVTSTVLVPDFAIPSSEADAIQCKENHFVRKVEKINLQAGSGRYFVLEKLPIISENFKTTNIYRWIATADINEELSLRLLKCRQLINSDALIISQEKMSAVADPLESGGRDMEIIEGLDFVNQVLVGASQFVLVSAISDFVQPDQVYSIYSNMAGSNVGKIKIVKRKGQLAVGYVLEASDAIQLNDKLVPH